MKIAKATMVQFFMPHSVDLSLEVWTWETSGTFLAVAV